MTGNVLVTRMAGHVTRELAEERFRQFRARLGFLRAPRWIIEQSAMTGFDPRAVAAGSLWSNLFSEHGGKNIIIVSKISGARMVAASLAFAVRINISSCSDLSAALALLGVEQPAFT